MGVPTVKPMNSTPKVGEYLRVSTVAQDLEKNNAEILALANQQRPGEGPLRGGDGLSGKVPWRKRRITEVLESFSADRGMGDERRRLGRTLPISASR